MTTCRIEDLDLGARYEPLGVSEAGSSVTYLLQRNASGLSGFFKGLVGEKQIIEVDERSSFEFAKKFAAASPRLMSHSDSAYAFDHAGASIQKAKLDLGLALDCPEHAYVSSIIKVGHYRPID